MVDANVIAPVALAPSVSFAEPVPPVSFSVDALAAGEATFDAYQAFCAEAVYAAPQDPLFVGGWTQATSAETLVASIRQNGQPLLMVALEIERRGSFTIAQFPGRRHANGNFPPVRPGEAISEGLLRALIGEIRRVRPGIDIFVLERLDPERCEVANPLLPLSTGRSPNVALAVDLAGGFDALLERASGKRKRKKNRSQTRKFEAGGGYRFVRADTPAETDRLMNAFFAMKHERFRQMGIADVFADEAVRAFFRGLFRDALDKHPSPFTLEGLEVAGRLRAVTGTSRSGNRLTCEFGAISDDEFAPSSPGDFLFFENIQQACTDGFAIYDFGVGDEPYKRQWCDLETHHFDVFLPVSAKGHALALAHRGAARLKSSVKSNAALWQRLKRLRRFVGGKKTAQSKSPSAEQD